MIKCQCKWSLAQEVARGDLCLLMVVLQVTVSLCVCVYFYIYKKIYMKCVYVKIHLRLD